MTPVQRLAVAVEAVEDHRYPGFWDWFGIGELIEAARAVVTEQAVDLDAAEDDERTHIGAWTR